jgi:hypothetical protein
MRKQTAYYRTSDGSFDYQFSFEEQNDGTWRPYILNQPSYNGRETDQHSTHRLADGSRNYVCWDRLLETLEEAKKVAAIWADKTQEYIRSGNRF